MLIAATRSSFIFVACFYCFGPFRSHVHISHTNLFYELAISKAMPWLAITTKKTRNEVHGTECSLSRWPCIAIQRIRHAVGGWLASGENKKRKSDEENVARQIYSKCVCTNAGLLATITLWCTSKSAIRRFHSGCAIAVSPSFGPSKCFCFLHISHISMRNLFI